MDSSIYNYGTYIPYEPIQPQGYDLLRGEMETPNADILNVLAARTEGTIGLYSWHEPAQMDLYGRSDNIYGGQGGRYDMPSNQAADTSYAGKSSKSYHSAFYWNSTLPCLAPSQLLTQVYWTSMVPSLTKRSG